MCAAGAHLKVREMASAVVAHGRRKGSLRSNTTSEEVTKPGQVTVLSEKDWHRLKSKATMGLSSEPRRKTDRNELHEVSKRIVKNWDNTIEGQRIKRLQAREIREAEEEAERVQLDLEEARFQTAKRKEAIEKAKTMLYYQTDRVKQFHRTAVLSEVLKERDAQLEYKKRRKEALKDQDATFLQFQEQERNQGILTDLKAAEDRAAQRRAVSQFQQMQINEKAKKSLDKRQAALDEQKTLEKEVADFHAKQQHLEEQQRLEKLTLRRELDEVLENKKQCEEKRQLKEKNEAEERRIFADAKKRMTELRKEKEIELFQEFQTHQQRMCNLLGEQMQEAASEEDGRIAKAVAEQASKREEEEREKERRFTEANRAIHRHMLEQMAESEKKRKDQIKMDQELLQQRIIQDQKFHSQELIKSQKASKTAKDQQQYHLSQMAELAERKQAIRLEDVNYTRKNADLLKVEEKQFQEYATNLINEAKERGAPVGPLIKGACVGAGGGRGPVIHGAAGMRPSYQVMDSSGVEMPTYNPRPSFKDTQKRMGFTW